MSSLRYLLAALVFASLHVEFVHAGTPTVTLSASVTEVNEGTTFIITATLSEPVAFNASFPLSYSGPAGNGGDIDIRSTIFISAGQTTGTRSIRTNQDTLIEGTEAVIITINPGPAGIVVGDPGSVSVDILDDDLATSVSLSLDADETVEGLPFLITATLAEPINNDATIRWDWGGTATPSADFISGGTVVIIPAGETSASRSIRTLDDTAVEGPETVVVTLSSATPNVSFGDPESVTVTIIDNDVPGVVTLGVSETVVTEGEIVSILLTATLDQPVNNDVNVSLDYAGTATFGVDYSAGTTILIPAGQTTGTRSFGTLDDTAIEPDEIIIVSLASAGPNVTIGSPNEVTVTIQDDDLGGVVTLGVSETVVTEGEIVSILLTATLDQPVNNDVNVTLDYAGTATFGVDYSAGTTILIPAGQLTGTRSFGTLNDTAIEPDETIIVSLASAGPNVTISSPDEVTITIQDDDLAGVVTLGVSETVVTEGEIVSILLTATLDQPVNNDVNVTLDYAGTATFGVDYSAGTTILIPAGQTSGTRSFGTLDDLAEEPTETIIITLSSAGPNITIGTPDEVTVEILDNDSDPVADLAVDISSSGQVRFGGFVYWSILVDNLGPNEAIGARVVNDFPANVSGVVWVCSSDDGGLCPSGGSGNIDTLIDLPSGSAVEFSACAIAEVFEDGGFVANSATVIAPADTEDPNPANNSDTLTIENIYLFADGFEDFGPESICATLLAP